MLETAKVQDFKFFNLSDNKWSLISVSDYYKNFSVQQFEDGETINLMIEFSKNKEAQGNQEEFDQNSVAVIELNLNQSDENVLYDLLQVIEKNQVNLLSVDFSFLML